MRHILALLALGLAATVQASAPTETLDTLIDREMPPSGAPGLAYAAVDNGKVRAGARGEAEKGGGARVTPETPFLLGSVAKSFTAVAVMQLVEAGKVDLDAPVSRYLKRFEGQPGAAVTIRQLLSHTSGFSTLQGNLVPEDEGSAADALARHVARVAAWQPAYSPGTRWEYSNANYQILGALIETVSGQDYAAYVAGHVLQPIGMRHSFVADGRRHAEMATGHVPWFGGKRALMPGDTDRITAPQGGVIASAADLALYLAAMMNGRDDVLSAASKAMMLRPAGDASPFYGLGWFIDAEKGTVYHTGASPGVETLAVMMPSEKKGAVVLVNAGSGIGFGETAQLRNGVASHLLGLDYGGEGSRWQQQTLYIGFALAPLLFLFSIFWAWRHRRQLRAKTGAFGLFSLWFPLVTTVALAGVVFWLIPLLFGVSIALLGRFQPDLVLLLTATAVTGVAWALIRLGLAYGGRRRAAG